jgi:predicted lipid-binding transport protein (Tim44 family)
VDSDLIQILILAAVALLVGARFYGVLGQRRGSERPNQVTPRPATADTRAPTAPPAPANPHLNIGATGIAAIIQADPTFDPAQFLAGARAAYDMIVQAFAQGDKETLRPLLSQRVFDTYAAAIDRRIAEGGKGPELVRLKNAEIVDGRLEAEMARVWVKFEAELAEGAHGLRDTRERWMFERDVRSRDPNWLLAGVAQA